MLCCKGGSWGLLARSWVVFGAHVLLSGGSLGLLASSWMVLGVHVLLSGGLMEALGSLLGGLGTFLEDPGAVLVALGRSWGHLGPKMSSRAKKKSYNYFLGTLLGAKSESKIDQNRSQERSKM